MWTAVFGPGPVTGTGCEVAAVCKKYALELLIILGGKWQRRGTHRLVLGQEETRLWC